MWDSLRRALPFFGPDAAPVSHTERLVSAAGGFVGILFIYLTGLHFFGPDSAALIVASMGASAVLLFAVPHGQLSQPWPLIGGHLLSAAIGVTCAQLLPDPMVAAATAVALAIGVMYYLHCLHPPGGATALTAVIGGSEIHALGYQYILTPVLLNVAVMLVCAIAVNYFFAWRRYPASLVRRPHVHKETAEHKEGEITHGDLVYALSKLDSFVDVTEGDLAEIYALAAEHAHPPQLDPREIRLGRAYSNGRYAEDWSVRQVVDVSGRSDPNEDMVIYKVVAGQGRRSSGVCTRSEFARWASYEVVRKENDWHKLADAQLLAS